jgi:hypothetical protein
LVSVVGGEFCDLVETRVILFGVGVIGFQVWWIE